MWDNSHPSGKILNALDLLLYNDNTKFTEYTSDLYAWDMTCSHHHINPTSLCSIKHMQWAFFDYKNTIIFFYIDCEGLDTDVFVVDGGKL